MAGFGGFGTGSTGGGLFGAKPPDQTTGGFGTPATTTITTTTGGLTFGTPTFGTGGTGLFGTAAAQQTPTFGTGGFGIKPTVPTTQPATGITGGFTLGAANNNPSSFSFGTSNAPTFGTTAAAPTFGTTPAAPTFGTTPAAPTFGTTSAAPTFGTTPAAPTFGTTPAAPTFGTTSAAPTFGTTAAPLTFGAPKTTAPTALVAPNTTTPATGTPATPGFNFGVTLTTATTTAAAPLAFGVTPATTAAPAAPTLSFGVSAAGSVSTTITATTATTATTTQAKGFTLSQPATTSLTFGVPKTTGGLTFGTGTTGFGTTTTTGTSTFTLGTSTTTTPTLGTGLFGTPKTTQSLSVTTSTTTTTTTASLGLGGIDSGQTTQGLSGSKTAEPKQAKDHPLPDPILQTLNEFQNFTKQQKSISVEISHGSSKPLKKVQEDTEAMESLLTTITSGLTRNAIAVDKLKTETAQGLHQAEMAQRNHETPPGLEYDNSAPADYFNDLVTKFETDTVRLRVQIEASEKHLRSLTQSSTISPQELTLAMRRLHETLIVLAARVQALHTSVQSQKEQYKNLRRVYFKDDTNIFENETDQNLVKKQTIYSLRSLTGPTPFSETPGAGLHLNLDDLAILASSAGTSVPATGSNPSWMSPVQGTGNTGSLLPTSSILSTFQPVEVPGFQLSKPPTGNKRSRR